MGRKAKASSEEPSKTWEGVGNFTLGLRKPLVGFEKGWVTRVHSYSRRPSVESGAEKDGNGSRETQTRLTSAGGAAEGGHLGLSQT